MSSFSLPLCPLEIGSQAVHFISAVMTVQVSGVLNNNLPVLTWDCRTSREHVAGRMAKAAHIDLDGMRFGNHQQAEADRRHLLEANELLTPYKRTHLPRRLRRS